MADVVGFVYSVQRRRDAARGLQSCAVVEREEDRVRSDLC